MSIKTRLLIPCISLLIAMSGMLYAPTVRADEIADMGRLDTILTLSDRDNKEALKQLVVFKQELPASTTYAVRLDVLKTLVSLYYDAGMIKSSAAAIEELSKLAQVHHDQNAMALAKIAQAYRQFDDGKIDQAISALSRIQIAERDNADPEFNMQLNNALGVMYGTTGNFDVALKYYYEALRLSDQQPRRKIEARLYKLDSIAKLYSAMKDPERALKITQEALALTPVANAPKTRASLLLSQGIFYSQLKKSDESLAANELALTISKDANMPVMVATAIVNIADHYLITHDYIKAEAFARQGVALGEKLGDKAMIEGAKINLGFALAGQGKIKEGVPLVMHAIAFFKESNAKADAEATLSELANMYERAGLYKEALASLRQQQALSDDIFRSDRSLAVATLQEQYSANQRQKQIELLAKANALKDAEIQNRRLLQIVTLLGAGLFLAVGTFIYCLYRRVRSSNDRLLAANTQLEFHSTRDPLTGLHNRRAFVELMKSRAQIVQSERRAENIDSIDGLILMDIDQFKKINDTYGHAVGDTILKEIARRLKNTVRESDMVLRWGGEEFLIFTPKSNPAQITALVERILHAIAEEVFIDGAINIRVTLTAGFISLPFAGVPETICSWEKTLQIADMALYLGKAHGRNRAYGIAQLLVPHELAMPILDHDLSAAREAGMVELIEVIGPEV